MFDLIKCVQKILLNLLNLIFLYSFVHLKNNLYEGIILYKVLSIHLTGHLYVYLSIYMPKPNR